MKDDIEDLIDSLAGPTDLVSTVYFQTWISADLLKSAWRELKLVQQMGDDPTPSQKFVAQLLYAANGGFGE
jgi:hypothetical protein